jgi:hypothetical protein
MSAAAFDDVARKAAAAKMIASAGRHIEVSIRLKARQGYLARRRISSLDQAVIHP